MHTYSLLCIIALGVVIPPFREKQIGSGNHLGSLLSDKVVVSSLQEPCMLDSYAEDVASRFSALMAGERAWWIPRFARGDSKALSRDYMIQDPFFPVMKVSLTLLEASHPSQLVVNLAPENRVLKITLLLCLHPGWMYPLQMGTLLPPC